MDKGIKRYLINYSPCKPQVKESIKKAGEVISPALIQIFPVAARQENYFYAFTLKALPCG